MAKGTVGAELLYVGIFRTVIVGMWLSWVAIIVALISCAPIFPEFMEEGSAGVALSKPVSRPKLFFYKWLGAMLFMAVQASLFAVIVFFAIRLRIGYWNPSIFWSIPVLLLVFSYLYSVVVWLGIKLRSVMASVMGALIFWLVCFAAFFTENFVYGAGYHGVNPFGGGFSMKMTEEERAPWKKAYPWARIPHVILPKPGQTTTLLDRWIVMGSGKSLGGSLIDAMDQDAMAESAKDDLWRQSPVWVIGTSLLFEALVLAWACRNFSRRDF